MNRLIILLLAAVFTWGASQPVSAEVRNAAAGGFAIEHHLDLPVKPKVVYQALIENIGQWWLADHTYSGSSNNLYIEARAGGCFCERMPDGGSVLHMLISYIQPGREVRMVGGLGPLQMMGLSGGMQFKMTSKDDGSYLEFSYKVSGYSADGLVGLAAIVDRVWADQLASLSAFLTPAE